MSEVVVPHHAHITVDEDSYWGLMYLHIEVRRMLDDGRLDDPVLRASSNDVERRLAQSRHWNQADPNHGTPS